jgi:hypothetical protein
MKLLLRGMENFRKVGAYSELNVLQPLPVNWVRRLEKEKILPRRIAIVMGLLLMTAAGFAQVPTAGNVYLGYALNRASTGPGWGSAGNLNGWELSAEGKLAPFVGIVGDIGTQYGTLQVPTVKLFGGSGNTSTQTRVVSYMVGPRVSFSVGKFRPFAQALVGGGHLHQDTPQFPAGYSYGETCMTDAVGGGLDYKILPMFALRVQGDALQTRFRNGRQTDGRFTTGLVFRF